MRDDVLEMIWQRMLDDIRQRIENAFLMGFCVGFVAATVIGALL